MKSIWKVFDSSGKYYGLIATEDFLDIMGVKLRASNLCLIKEMDIKVEYIGEVNVS